MLERILWIFGLVCAIWVIYDVLVVNQELNKTKKVLWILAAILFSIITAIVYYFVYKR